MNDEKSAFELLIENMIAAIRILHNAPNMKLECTISTEKAGWSIRFTGDGMTVFGEVKPSLHAALLSAFSKLKIILETARKSTKTEISQKEAKLQIIENSIAILPAMNEGTK